MLVAIPPHRGSRIVREAGLANEAGWVAVDRATLATKDESVYALGDVAAIPIPGRWRPDVPMMLPKAGVFAQAQSLVVARRLAAWITGTEAQDKFCGDGYCMLEAGEQLAGFAFGRFFDEPSPQVKLRQMGRTWNIGKVKFEKWSLASPGMKRELLRLGINLGAKALRVPFVL
jgi:sulfide:quinone oxidoreductase